MSLPYNDFIDRAKFLDENDPLNGFRSLFHIPVDLNGDERIYFCNHSLGLPAKDAFTRVQKHMKSWAELGVEGWFKGEDNWYSATEQPLKVALASILGAKLSEVVVMNSLTVNFHLMLTSFYQPTAERYKIIAFAPLFPSDLYAIKSHIKNHGLDANEALCILEPRTGEFLLRDEDIAEIIRKEGQKTALVFLNAVNFLTGQFFNIENIASIAKAQGCRMGMDLAHAAGNVPLKLHEWGIDFAIGCSYKYLSGGPGAPGIAFVHEEHHKSELPRLSGWWGNDPARRFQMHLIPDFVPFGGASSWQVSTAPVIGIGPLLASMKIITETGIDRMRTKSKLQTELLLDMLHLLPQHNFQVISPCEIHKRGCQTSLLIRGDGEKVVAHLSQKGLVCDFRRPNVIRIAPSPLYNTFGEIVEFVKCFVEVMR